MYAVLFHSPVYDTENTYMYVIVQFWHRLRNNVYASNMFCGRSQIKKFGGTNAKLHTILGREMFIKEQVHMHGDLIAMQLCFYL